MPCVPAPGAKTARDRERRPRSAAAGSRYPPTHPGALHPAGVSELHEFDEAAVLEKYASRLAIRRVRILGGDPSDGLPSVHGVGEKTARGLVQAYPDLDAMLATPPAHPGARALEGQARRAIATARCSRLPRRHAATGAHQCGSGAPRMDRRSMGRCRARRGSGTRLEGTGPAVVRSPGQRRWLEPARAAVVVATLLLARRRVGEPRAQAQLRLGFGFGRCCGFGLLGRLAFGLGRRRVRRSDGPGLALARARVR